MPPHSSRSSRLLQTLQSRPLLLILALALVLRLLPVSVHSLHHPDELFQYLEQAHRLALGYGIVPWEYRVGVRNWLIPILLAGPIWLSDALGFTSPVYVPAIRVLLAVLSLTVVASFFAIGRSVSLTHAIVAGFVGAVWFELVYFASHALSESISLALFAPAAALLKEGEKKPARNIMIAGFLLGIAVLMRFQIGPAAAVLALLTCGVRFRKLWLPLAAGGLAALVLGALVDFANGMTPYSWVIRNFSVNVMEGRAATYGVAGPTFYFAVVGAQWQTTALIILPLALWGARHHPALLAAAAVHGLAHLLIGHKEYRFILLATAMVVLLASLGFADVLRWAWRDFSIRQKQLALAGSLAFWLLTSMMLAAGDRFRFRWTEGGSSLAATETAGAVPGICGLATFGTHFAVTGGYAHLHRNVPIYPFTIMERPEAGALSRYAGGYNVVLARQAHEAFLPPQYKRRSCSSPQGAARPFASRPRENLTICVYVRPGRCGPPPPWPTINEWLASRGE